MSKFRLPTRVGAARFGDNLFMGRSVSQQLAGRQTHWELLALSVGHASLDPSNVPLLDDMVVCCVAADPRIWPLKIVRLASAYGSVNAGAFAGAYCTVGSPFGWRSCALAASGFQAIASSSQTLGEAIAARGKKPLHGFGVPSRAEDERVIALRECVKRRRRPEGRFWDLAHRIESQLGRVPLNIGGACGALLLDFGFSPRQIEALGPTLAMPNYLANALEGADQAPQMLQTLPPETIDDRTPPARLSPRAKKPGSSG